MSITPENAELIKKLQLKNVIQKVKNGKSLTSSERKLIEEFSVKESNEAKAKKIIADGLAIMQLIAKIINESKLSAADKKIIQEKILALNGERT